MALRNRGSLGELSIPAGHGVDELKGGVYEAELLEHSDRAPGSA